MKENTAHEEKHSYVDATYSINHLNDIQIAVACSYPNAGAILTLASGAARICFLYNILFLLKTSGKVPG